jgi:hypothetical protein
MPWSLLNRDLKMVIDGIGHEKHRPPTHSITFVMAFYLLYTDLEMFIDGIGHCDGQSWPNELSLSVKIINGHLA